MNNNKILKDRVRGRKPKGSENLITRNYTEGEVKFIRAIFRRFAKIAKMPYDNPEKQAILLVIS